jgi:glycosyltransferase involved in cell wall biosynthesis
MAEIVKDEGTGVFFSSGNSDDLAEKAAWLWNHPEESAHMGQNARLEYEQKYSSERNYQLLIDVYEHAISEKKYEYPHNI